MIEQGTRRVRGCEAALGFSAGGSEQVAVDLLILDGPDEGLHITWFASFSDKAMDRTLESLRLLGWQGDDLSNLAGIGDTEAFAVIEHEEYEGVLRAKVKWINGAGGLQLKTRMEPGQAAAFAAKMKGRVLAAKQRAPGAAPANAAPKPPPRAAAPQHPGVASGSPGTRATAALVGAPEDDQIPF